MILKIKNLTVIIFSLLIMSGCANAQENRNAKNILIVYLSRTKNTKAVAEMIHQSVGGNLVELELENSYPEDYKKIVEQVQKENETDFLPKLKTKIDRIEKFDIVFIGFPTWGMKLPPPVKSFLKQYDLKGKTIIPFNTNAGYGAGSSFKTVKELAPNSKILEGFSVEGGKERDGVLFVMKGVKERKVRDEVEKWLEKINLN